MKRLKITTLDKGWRDKDEVLLHAAFQLLADFVEVDVSHDNPAAP
jgi:hypothetical protein